MSLLERQLLRRFRSKYGLLTIDEVLLRAVDVEQSKLACGERSPAWEHFALQQFELEAMAQLLEQVSYPH